MKIVLLGLLLITTLVFANEAPITLEHVNVNIHDYASILRGAKLFAGTCMVCHTAKYLTHDRLAKSAGITADKMPLNQKEWMYNVVPPDLSLAARQHSPDWIYTYLHAFYQDSARPTGYNNLLVTNSVMTNIVAGMQGLQKKLPDNEVMKSTLDNPPHYYQVLQLIQSGTMTPEEFDNMTRDLVNFLVYASDPHAVERKNIGIYVLLFLALFFVVVYALKKVIWEKVL